MPTTTQNLFEAGYRIAPHVAPGLFEVYSPAGKVYFVDAERIHCSCPASARCKHLKGLGGLIREQIAHYSALRVQVAQGRTTANGVQKDSLIRLLESAELSLQLHRAFVLNPNCEAFDDGTRQGLVTFGDVRTAERKAA